MSPLSTREFHQRASKKTGEKPYFHGKFLTISREKSYCDCFSRFFLLRKAIEAFLLTFISERIRCSFSSSSAPAILVFMKNFPSFYWIYKNTNENLAVNNMPSCDNNGAKGKFWEEKGKNVVSLEDAGVDQVLLDCSWSILSFFAAPSTKGALQR